MLCVSRDLFNEQAGAGGRLHERKLPMGDGEERKTPTRILEEEEEVRNRHSSALSPPFRSPSSHLFQNLPIAITYVSLISYFFYRFTWPCAFCLFSMLFYA